MRVLVTGGCGFIGSHIVDLLVEANHEVLVVDNLSTGRMENLNKRAKLKVHDITEPGLLEIFQAFRPEAVIHEAAQIDVKTSMEKPEDDAQVNVIGTVKVLECCRKTGVQKIIYASSAAIYGNPITLPVSEEHPKKPMSAYGISKRIPEEYIQLYHRLYGINYTILRYANVYGERQDAHGEGGVVAIFAAQLKKGLGVKIFGDGSQTRDFIYVRDIAKANLLALQSSENWIVNVSRNEASTVNKLLETMQDAFDQKASEIEYLPARKCDIEHSYLDNQLLSKTLNWKPEYSLRDGLQSMADHIFS